MTAADVTAGLFPGKTYDGIYIQSWREAVAYCAQKLEGDDEARARRVKTAEEFRAAVVTLRNECTDESSRQDIMRLCPTIDYYDKFANTFLAIMADAVEISMLWGLLFLVVSLSLESKGTIGRTGRMVKEIGHKLRMINEYSRSLVDVKDETLEIICDIITLWLNSIMFFRTQTLGLIDADSLSTLTCMYDEAVQNIEDAVHRVEQIARLPARQSMMVGLTMLHDHPHLPSTPLDASSFPCDTIPFAKNKRFFGRQDILQEIEEQLCDSERGLSSVAIYGLAGVGKTQIALEYAYKAQAVVDAVLWIPAESDLALQQGLGHVACVLKLQGADPDAHQNNTVLLMNWLKKTTGATWLLIFDNVDSSRVFERFWPVARRGSILITTKRRTVASQLVDKAIEIREFGPIPGAKFLLHSLGMVLDESDEEFRVAIDLSKKLSGHALAISQMAAFIKARQLVLKDFEHLYDKCKKRIHRERKAGWKYIGYTDALDTVWLLSFKSLNSDDRLCLGAFSYLAPDFIPTMLLEVLDKNGELPALRFFSDDFARGEVIEHLTDLGLVRLDRTTQMLSVHRLVQLEFKFHLSESERQESFDAATLLLLKVFPARGTSRVIIEDPLAGERYIIQVLALIKNWKKERTSLRSSGNFCSLICNAAWFLERNDTADNLTWVLAAGLDAFQAWDDPSTDRLILAYLLEESATHDLYLGEFNIALTHAQESLRIRLSILPPDDEEVLNDYNTLAIVYGSRGDYDRGLNYLGRAEGILKEDPGMFPLKSILLNTNYGRNHYLMGNFLEAERRLDLAWAELRGLDNWAWNGHIHIAFGSMFYRSGDLLRSEHHLQLSQQAFEKFRDERSKGLLAYHLGRLYLLQARTKESIAQLEDAVAIDKIIESPRGVRARNLYALSRALCADDPRREEGIRLGAEAKELRGASEQGKNKLLDSEEDSFTAFDLLVRITER